MAPLVQLGIQIIVIPVLKAAVRYGVRWLRNNPKGMTKELTDEVLGVIAESPANPVEASMLSDAFSALKVAALDK